MPKAGRQKGPPQLNTPLYQVETGKALIKLLHYCSAWHISPDAVHLFKNPFGFIALSSVHL
jgi:hypothetical protein